MPVDIELDLPLPISVSAIWRSNRGRVHRSDAYAKWQKAADMLVMAQPGWRNKKINGPFIGTIILNPSMMRANSDLDNKFKVIADFCVRLGLIVDDSVQYARQWTIKLGNDENAPCGCRVILRSLDNAD